MKGIYIVGNYPDTPTFRSNCSIIKECGFDFIEIGLPFNDPVADGPVISSAITDAIDRGVQIEEVIDEITAMEKMDIKKYIMTYSNIVYSYGINKFSERLHGIIDGIIIPDLPNRLVHMFQERGLEIPVVPFATLETRDEDMDIISSSNAEFVYFIGVRGITGASSNLTSDEIVAQVEKIKSKTRKKVIIGFGIKTHKDALKAIKLGDGYVVGTEAVKRQNDPALLKEYLITLIGK